MSERFVLYTGAKEYEIVDKVESEELNAICIYNNLGHIGFSSAPALCDLLNELNNENDYFKYLIKDIIIALSKDVKFNGNHYTATVTVDRKTYELLLNIYMNDERKNLRKYDYEESKS